MFARGYCLRNRRSKNRQPISSCNLHAAAGLCRQTFNPILFDIIITIMTSMKDQARNEVVIAEDDDSTKSDEEELGSMNTISQCTESLGE